MTKTAAEEQKIGTPFLEPGPYLLELSNRFVKDDTLDINELSHLKISALCLRLSKIN